MQSINLKVQKSSFEKLIQKILAGRQASYEEAEQILLKLGFERTVKGSHHTFRKNAYLKNISIKRRPQLLAYQLRILQQIVRDHGYKDNN